MLVACQGFPWSTLILTAGPALGAIAGGLAYRWGK